MSRSAFSRAGRRVVLGMMLLAFCSTGASAQEARSPRSALLKASLVPGWGQVYNRQFYKVPILYAGIGFFVYTAIQTNSDYRLYRNAYQYRAFVDLVGEDGENPAAGFQSDYDQIAAEFGPIGASSLERQRDTLRRNRDLSILGVGAFWALGVLDAYVSAHMSSFDVGENLTMRAAPEIRIGQGLGASLTLSW